MRYPAWKYVLIVLIGIISVLYSLPNMYPDEPALQVSGANAGVKVDQAVLQRAEDGLRAAGIAFHFKQWGQFIPVGQTDKTWYNSGDLMFAADGATPMHAIRLKSKHDAGRQLDGREWNELPEVPA
jgi:protein gp37